MANMHDCIDAAVNTGQLNGAAAQAKAQAAKNVYTELYERYRTVMPDAQAQMLAKKDLGQATRRAKHSRFHAVTNQLQTMRRIHGLLAQSDRPDLHLQSMVEFIEGSGYTGESVASLQRAYVSSINSGIQDFLKQTGFRVTGTSRNRKLLDDVIRELHAEATGNAQAQQMADAVRAQQQRMRREFNARGGDIGELSDYGIMHTHDPVAMRKAGKDTWRRALLSDDGATSPLDWSRIVNKRTGQPFATQPGQRLAGGDLADARAMLDEIYGNVTSMGWQNRYPKMMATGKALYNQRAEARVLHFKSGTDWLAYNKTFGTGDPFSSAVGGLHGLARDVALMRVLGPNPNAGMEFASQTARKRAQELRTKGQKNRDLLGFRRDIDKLTERAATRTKAMLAHADGTANTPAEGYEWAASFMGATRQYVVSTKLGSALLSSVTDTATMEIAAQTIGMGGGRVLTRHVDLMASAASRETAAQMGWVADTLATTGAGAARYLGETFSPEVTRRLADFTLRVSGLNFWTDMGRTAFKMEMSGYLATNAGRALKDVDAPLRALLEGRGITAAEWDILRDPASLMTAPNGANFLSPQWWLEHQTTLPRDQAEGLAMRLQAIFEEQQELAIPSVNLAGRVAFQGASQPGTPLGELARSGVMFKSFAMSLMINQVRRFWAQPTPLARAAYAVKLAASLTLMGAMAVQLKELAKGRDPRPMDSSTFWAAAGLQGGGLGIFGDFFAASTNRFGGGFAETLAGPVVGLAADLAVPIGSNLSRAAQGENVLLGRDVANLVRYQTPAASSLWYGRRAWDAAVGDQLQLLLDPEADIAFRRATRRAERDYGTSLWWERGQLAPSRAPDLSNALGGGQ